MSTMMVTIILSSQGGVIPLSSTSLNIMASFEELWSRNDLYYVSPKRGSVYASSYRDNIFWIRPSKLLIKTLTSPPSTETFIVRWGVDTTTFISFKVGPLSILHSCAGQFNHESIRL